MDVDVPSNEAGQKAFANGKKKGKKNKQRDRDQNARGDGYSALVKDNEQFFTYCKFQQIVPEDEWKAFEDTLRTELPASFRIQRSLPEREQFIALLEKKYFEPLRALENEEIHCPAPIPFIPYAYQTSNSRNTIRASHLLSDLHQFLIFETAVGAISRQEAVSMVPPLLLDIQSHHHVLDACASPGSKTAQIMELMREKSSTPEGLLVANDIDNKRCYMLVHQTLNRLPTSNVVVVNHDAGLMPAPIDKEGKPRLFDRILCDVICSGDGTFRKNIELWRSWTVGKALNLHRLQINIARRCLELLNVGGLMAYSTCSLNPIEDEAVLTYLLRTYKGAIELVDVSNEMPELKRSPGKSHWKVFNYSMKEYTNYEDAQKAADKPIMPSMFPPTAEETKEFHLDRSFRILPHAQNSGGFFVAIIRKTRDFDTPLVVDPRPFKPVPAKKRRTVREDPFVFLNNDDAELKEELNTIYGIDPSFPYENLLVRTENTDKKKGIYFVNSALREFMQSNLERFYVVNAGISVLRKHDKVGCCNYRLAQDGLSTMLPYIHKRIIEVNVEDMAKILAGSNGLSYVRLDELKAESKFVGHRSGCMIVRVKYSNMQKEICTWMGASTVSAFVTREDKIHLLNILDCDSSSLQNLALTARRNKGKRQTEDASNNGEENATEVDMVESPTGNDAEVKAEVKSEIDES